MSEELGPLHFPLPPEEGQLAEGGKDHRPFALGALGVAEAEGRGSFEGGTEEAAEKLGLTNATRLQGD